MNAVVTIGIIAALATAAQIVTNVLVVKGIRRIEMTNQELLDKVNTATNAVSDRVAALIASITASGATLTAAQQTEADAITTHLDAIAANSTTPVPAPPPVTPGL